MKNQRTRLLRQINEGMQDLRKDPNSGYWFLTRNQTVELWGLTLICNEFLQRFFHFEYAPQLLDLVVSLTPRAGSLPLLFDRACTRSSWWLVQPETRSIFGNVHLRLCELFPRCTHARIYLSVYYV